jgi:hypothetical protein
MRIYKSRRNYWSCSKFADWLSSVLKLSPKYSESSNNWSAVFEDSTPPQLVEDTLDAIQNVIMYPLDVLDSVRVYVRNRFITRTHLMDTKLTPGEWHELDDRLLCGMMESLVNFIEIEKASMQDWSDPLVDKPWWKKIKWLRFDDGRNPPQGIAYLDWEMTLTNDDTGLPSKQAQSALEQWTIYNWWKNIRPLRPEVLDVTGYMEFRHTEHKTDEIKLGQILDEIQQLEADREAEDQEMMIRLIKIRQHLWT